MAQPVATFTLGGTDISDRVGSAPGTATVEWGRGAAFDGGAAPPGWCIVRVKNADRAFNPRNGSSPLTSVLRIGKAGRLTCTYSATTYYLFHGFLRRIVPLDDHFAELHFADALYNFGRREASAALSVTRSLAEFRGAILDSLGESGGNRNLSTAGAEASVTFTGADEENALSLLEDINAATGTAHFVKPTAAAYQYTTIDRTVIQGTASVETWDDTDLANPFAESLNWYDYTDERIINQQRVQASSRVIADEMSEIWQRDRLHFSASQVRTFWAEYEEPTFNADLTDGADELTYTTISGGGTAAVTPFMTSAKIVMTAGASGWVVDDITIAGRPAVAEDWETAISEDGTSQTTYGGVLKGSTIDSPYLASESIAKGLGDWIIYRYRDPRANPQPAFVNRFPTQLQREIGDRISYTASEHSAAALECIIAAFRSTISNSGARWTTEYQLEEVPAAVTLFRIGGSAGEGVGGTGILAY